MENNFKSKFSKKVSLMGVWDHSSSVWYNVDCDCNSPEHRCGIEIEFDKEINMISLHFYKTVSFDWWKYDVDKISGRLQNLWNRIKKSCKLLFTGELEMEDELIMMEFDHIESFIEALQEGLEYCKAEKIKRAEKMKEEKKQCTLQF